MWQNANNGWVLVKSIWVFPELLQLFHRFEISQNKKVGGGGGEEKYMWVKGSLYLSFYPMQKSIRM